MDTRSVSVPMDPQDATCPFPELPTEIIIQILEATARASRHGAYSISLVSSWARNLALPSLFATVVHRSKPSFAVTLSTGGKPIQPLGRPSTSLRWGHLIRNLWTENAGVSNASVEEAMFPACPNVENLALMSSSLRALSQAIQVRTAVFHSEDNQRRLDSPAPGETFLNRLRSITLITHTFRYDWHFLVGTRLQNGAQVLHNITHLRILDMRVSSFCPHNLLPGLTHLALPYLDLGNRFENGDLRLPAGILEHRGLRMIVLTVAEEQWLTNPWYQIALYPGKNDISPRETFRTLVQWARQRDDRIHVVLSPRWDVNACLEWADAARGGDSLWEIATDARVNDSHGAGLPDSYPKNRAR
ncbi:hypothetical protein C8Q78DRAFT_1065941 [Trametes maxima]|nr:hypothetical protein C8Q78DRAFT_1065941 [Trametes maxima]